MSSTKQKIMLLENIQNESSHLTYQQMLQNIDNIEPILKNNIDRDIKQNKMKLNNLHGKELQNAIDNIICNNIDKWISNSKNSILYL